MSAVHSDAISVTLGIGGAPYQKTLIPSLQRAGMLRRILSSGQCFEMKEPASDGTLRVIKRFPLHRVANRVAWGLWRRIPAKVRPRRPPAMAMIMFSDHLGARWMPRCTIYHGWSGLCLESLRVAKEQGTITLVENAARHPGHWHQAGVEECRRFGIDPREHSVTLSDRYIRRVEREYELCDRIVVPSTLSYRSLAEFGFAEKTVVVAPGVDTEFFSPRPRPEQQTFRICFVGRVELAKGAGYLLQAWKRLALPNAELFLIGEVKAEMSSLLRTHADSSVHTTGGLRPQELAERYRDSDLFVFPSVNEGLAQVLLEAMASGLPVVASDYSGAVDCVAEGKEGFIVPVRNVERLAEAILWCYQHRAETRSMGQAARARIESEFTLEHYNQRQIALYRALAE